MESLAAGIDLRIACFTWKWRSNTSSQKSRQSLPASCEIFLSANRIGLFLLGPLPPRSCDRHFVNTTMATTTRVYIQDQPWFPKPIAEKESGTILFGPLTILFRQNVVWGAIWKLIQVISYLTISVVRDYRISGNAFHRPNKMTIIFTKCMQMTKVSAQWKARLILALQSLMK